MSTTVPNFISRFNNLEGITIGERRKELFLLLKEINDFEHKDVLVGDIVNSLKPYTYLEKKFQVDILIYFRRYSELYTVLVEENEILLRPLWKQNWFFTKLLQENSNEFVVDELFQQLSYVTRIRFLKNVLYCISDEIRVNQLYDLVLRKYGHQNANLLLAGCSLQKIIQSLKLQGNEFIFSNQDIIFLHKYKSSYFVQLMRSEDTRKNFDFYDVNSKSLKKIAGYDFNFFLELFKHNGCSNIGKRLTKKLLKLKREFVINKVSDIYQALHLRTLLKGLKSDFKKFFFSTWPKSFKKFLMYNCLHALRYYSKEKHIDLIQEGLQVLYGKSFSDEPGLIFGFMTSNVLENIKDIQLRESLLEIIMRDSKDDYTLPQYYSIEKSIPILKKKISAADGVRTRETLVECLVKTCKINGDINALLEVLKYFSSRHRNDTDTIRSSFLTQIKDCFDMTELTEEHWNYILELIKWSKIKNEKYWGCGQIYILHIKYMHKIGASKETIDNLVSQYFNELVASLTSVWDHIKDIAELHEYIILSFVNRSQSITDNEEKTRFCFALFETILEWNKKYPLNQINFLNFPQIKESVITKLENPSYSIKCYMDKFITGKIPCDEEFLAQLESMLWDNLNTHFSTTIFEYYLRMKPMKVVAKFENFIKVVVHQYSSDSLCMWRLLKHYDHLKLPEFTVAHVMKNEMDYSVGSTVGIALGTLMDPIEYMKLMPIPEFEKLDVDDEENSQKYRMVESLLRYLKYLNSSTVLPVIVQFCKGDFLHSALTPLYYYFFHTAERHHLKQLEILSTKAVSVRKHAVKLACSVSPLQTTYALIKQMSETEKNQSGIEHLFHKTYKYFLSQQSGELWALVKLLAKSLDILESHAFEDICNIKRVPKGFELLCLKFLWELLDNSENQGHDVSSLKEKLIKSLNEDIFKELPYEFCSNLIKHKFLRFGDSNYKIIHGFVVNCLQYGSQKEELLKDIFSVIRDFKNNYILNAEFDISRKSRRYVESFVSDIHYVFSSIDNLDFAIIAKFFSYWMEVFTPEEDIKDFIKLRLLVELKCLNDFDSYSLRIASLFNEFVCKFGVLGIVDCFSSALFYSLPDRIFETDNYEKKKYQLALKLVELNDTSHVKLLAINLLPQEISENIECQQMLSRLIQILRNSDDNIVKINLDLFITSLES